MTSQNKAEIRISFLLSWGYLYSKDISSFFPWFQSISPSTIPSFPFPSLSSNFSFPFSKFCGARKPEILHWEVKVIICSSSWAADSSISGTTTAEGRMLQSRCLKAKNIQEKLHLMKNHCQMKTFVKIVSLEQRLHHKLSLGRYGHHSTWL